MKYDKSRRFTGMRGEGAVFFDNGRGPLAVGVRRGRVMSTLVKNPSNTERAPLAGRGSFSFFGGEAVVRAF